MRRVAATVILIALAVMLVLPGTAVAAGGLVIGELYAGSNSIGSPYDHDYVQIANPTAVAISLQGISIRYSLYSSDTERGRTQLSGTIAPGGYALIQEAAGLYGGPLPTPDFVGTINFVPDGGRVALVDDSLAGASLLMRPGQPGVIDFLGYGDLATVGEAVPVPTTLTTQALIRYLLVDTDNNNTDFVLGAPNPTGGGTGTPPPTGTGSVSVSVQAPPPAPVLTFGITAGTQPSGGSITDSALDFGLLSHGTAKTASHRLTVTTNAQAGYGVTASESTPLTSGGNTIPDVTGDGASITEIVPGAWGNASTYGFGYGLANTTGTDAAFTSGFKQFANLAGTETAQQVMTNEGAVTGSAVDVTYKVNIGPSQAAGTYTNTITYIATGGF